MSGTILGKHHATKGAQGGVVFILDEQLHWEAKRFADRGKPLGLARAGADGAIRSVLATAPASLRVSSRLAAGTSEWVCAHAHSC